jgi:Holliday junction resolvase RusA-like endonuclease
VARIGSRVVAYDPPKSRKYKDVVKLYATAQLKRLGDFQMFNDAVCVDIVFYLPIPTRWSKKKKTDAEYGIVRPTKKPDVDNLYKGLIDALTGIAWIDDSIITDASIKKRYTAETPRTELIIRGVV